MSSLDNLALLFAQELSRAVTAVGVLHLPGFRQVPTSARVFLGMSIALACFAAKSPHAVAGRIEDSFWVICLQNLISGLAIALLWNLVMEASSLAIQLASVQSGLSYASIIDPTNDTESGSLIGITQFCVLITFVTAGVHLEFLAALLETDRIWDVLRRDGPTLGVLKAMLGLSFHAGLRLGAPFIASMLILDILSAISGRFAERFQVTMLIFPVKWVAVLLILLASTATLHRVEGELAAKALSLIAGGR
jgi:flagellar biosynthetic protein FliR